MSILVKAKKLAVVAMRPQVLLGPSKYLLVLSHMRSRSTVLSHILGSNEEICGYSELHTPYVHYTDIIKMKINLYYDLRCDLRGKYLLDKLLHNRLHISKEVFGSNTVKVILLLREPESTIKSIVDLGRISKVKWFKDKQKALEYYCSRLLHLKKYAKMFEGEYFFLESGHLVEDSDRVLGELTEWLNLKAPLVNSYKKFKNTGKPRYGDYSENIHAGRLIKTQKQKDIDIPAEMLKIAESSYKDCRNFLMGNTKYLSRK